MNDTQTICCNVYIFWLYFFFFTSLENVLCLCLRGVVAMTLWICQSDGRRVVDGNWMKSNVWLKWSDKGDRRKLNRRYFVLISIFHLGISYCLSIDKQIFPFCKHTRMKVQKVKFVHLSLISTDNRGRSGATDWISGEKACRRGVGKAKRWNWTRGKSARGSGQSANGTRNDAWIRKTPWGSSFRRAKARGKHFERCPLSINFSSSFFFFRSNSSESNIFFFLYISFTPLSFCLLLSERLFLVCHFLVSFK